MWRTFDYTTHFAIYYNLYRIAEDNPEMVSYLDADGYLERAYRTAMAYFEVPYNILMGKHGHFMAGRTGLINKATFTSAICSTSSVPLSRKGERRMRPSCVVNGRRK